MADHSALWWSRCPTGEGKSVNIAGTYFNVRKVNLWEFFSFFDQSFKINNSQTHFVEFVHSFSLDSVVKNDIFDVTNLFESHKNFESIC